ncbi:glycosyl transferase, family 2 [Rhodobacteraceae bacterium KLH11]|nr:glycosyl transferase, family 2 [Rhodobacteraceae bacterium KLH11]
MTVAPDGETIPEASAVAIIILNWNAWADTIECLESLARLNYPNFHIFVCDNASSDASLDRLQQWARGELCILPARPDFAEYVTPPGFKTKAAPLAETSTNARLTVIKNPSNLGFAAGNNAGLRRALEDGFDFFWVLNADTVVEPDALTHLVSRLEAVEGAGLCGSLICYYDDPNLIQEAGGCASYPMIGLSRRLAADKKRSDDFDWRALEAKLGYISGACCLVSRDFLETVGLMSEAYFLYCEEIDWATRAKGQFSLVLAENSIIYHKKGLSTGSKTHGRTRSPSSSYYLWRARRRYNQTYAPLGLVALFGLGLAASLKSLLRRDTASARAILAGLADRPLKND